MENAIAALLLLIVLFVGFGLTHHRGRHSDGCAGCTGNGCSDKSECSNEEKSRQH
jgi:hypothetical protein